jgi:MoxR-like ATPase
MMAQPSTRGLPQSIDETLELLTEGGYVADRSLATVLYLSLTMQRPLFLEGEAGVGKTEIAANSSGCNVMKGSMSLLPSMSGTTPPK